VEEADRRGIAAVLAAHADLQPRSGRAAVLHRDLHELADALLVDRGERGALDDAAVDEVRDDAGLDVVARESQGGLREVVGPKREELPVLGDLARHEAGARELDHRADAEVATDRGALLDAHPQHEVAGQRELAGVGHERDHDLDAQTPGRRARAPRVRRGRSRAQATAVRAIATSGNGVDTIQALAGTGKTTMMRTLADAYRRAGYHVYGTAPTARAARELRDVAGVPSNTCTPCHAGSTADAFAQTRCC
jgi:hypothetical protein